MKSYLAFVLVIYMCWTPVSEVLSAENIQMQQVEEILIQWKEQLKKSPTDRDTLSRAISTLAERLIREIPDSPSRLDKLVNWTRSNPQENAPILSALWGQLDVPVNRASFLSQKLDNLDSLDQLRIITSLIKQDLVKPEAIEAALRGNEAPRIGVKEEQDFSAATYRQAFNSREGISDRVAAVIFSVTPVSAIMEALDSNLFRKELAIVDKIQQQRINLEDAKTDPEKERIWRGIESELKILLDEKQPVFDVYIARILAWRPIVAPAIIPTSYFLKTLQERETPLILFLLKGDLEAPINEIPQGRKTVLLTSLTSLTPTSSPNSVVQEKKYERLTSSESPSAQPTVSKIRSYRLFIWFTIALGALVIIGLILRSKYLK